jgi:hypothetical protein
MISKLDWIHELNIKYSTSTFDTDPFEPIPNPSRTIFPYLVTNKKTGNSYVELPYTLPQDHALFIILQEKDQSIWEKKLEWIASKGGMALVNTHPDYMLFKNNRCGLEEYPADYYLSFLHYLKDNYKGQYWNALPSEIAQFWRTEYQNADSRQSFQQDRNKFEYLHNERLTRANGH